MITQQWASVLFLRSGGQSTAPWRWGSRKFLLEHNLGGVKVVVQALVCELSTIGYLHLRVIEPAGSEEQIKPSV